MSDKRFVRFSSITGIELADLPIAAEVWLNDIASSGWSTRETLKLAHLYVRYMQEPDPEILRLAAVERSFGLDRSEVLNTLRLMVIYGAVESYDISDGHLRAALKLSFLNRLQVLEVRRRYSQLLPLKQRVLPWHAREDKWTLPLRQETGQDLMVQE
ncbi:MAG: hypothetical protein RLZ98_1643 [Pseudomonadota bacterium]|jgi:hypothetical protein